MSGSVEKPFSIGGFYGVKSKRKWVGIERSVENAVKKHQKEKIPKSYPSRIFGPCTKWQTFFRQQDAFAACRDLDKDLRVFAFESESFEGNTGQRMYLATSYPVFWHYYEQMEPFKRHHYEVIPQGCVSKLYFDLEFERAFNPGRDGDRMVDILIQIFCAALEKEFMVKCSRLDVLDLEASTEKKFSRHLIFQMGNVVFKNNIHAGNFVSHVLSNLLDWLHMTKPTQFVSDTFDENLHNQAANGINKGQHGLLATNSDPDNSECTNNRELHGKSDLKMPKMEVADKASGEDEPRMTTTTDFVTVKPYRHNDRCSRDTMSLAHKTPYGSEACMSTITDKIAVKTDQDNTKCKSETPERSETGMSLSTEGIAMKPDQDSTSCMTTATDKLTVKVEGSCVAKEFEDFSLEDLQQMLVKNKHGEDVLFCDLGVYTKNRNFRLYLSSKLNKNNPLRLSDKNKCTLPQTSDRNKYILPQLSRGNKYNSYTSQTTDQLGKDETVFYHSLVSNVLYTNSTKVLTFGNDTDKQFSQARGQRSQSLKVNKKESIDGYSKSPYPEVDDYISSIVTENGNRGAIRHWTYFHLGELLLYEISHYRFCHNIGRQHRSNNIMYIVDLRKGVFYQKCHDPDCHMQNYKSQEWSLPRHILPESFFDDDGVDDADGDVDGEMGDEELLNSTLEMEKELMATAADDANRETDKQDDMDDGNDEYLLEVAGQLENS